MEKNQDMLLEQQRLLSCLEIIRENIREYEEKEADDRRALRQHGTVSYHERICGSRYGYGRYPSGE